jgi:hypothetical protein
MCASQGTSSVIPKVQAEKCFLKMLLRKLKHMFYVDYTINTTKQNGRYVCIWNLYIKQSTMVSQYLPIPVTTK